MGFVGQTIATNVRKSSKNTNRSALGRVLRANKDLAKAVAALTKTKGRQAAIKEVMEKNPAFKMALAVELLK
jgi:MoxR-like ATPase